MWECDGIPASRPHVPAWAAQIEKCKLSMREALKACEDAGGDAVIPAEKYDPSGELDEEHIFCAKCRIGQCFEVRSSCPGAAAALLGSAARHALRSRCCGASLQCSAQAALEPAA